MNAYAHPLPGFEAPNTYAAHPVWSDSTTKEVRFQPMPKRVVVKLWHRARDFDRRTKRGARCHGGKLGPSALQVLHALLFDFLRYGTGRLDPSYAAIARKANVCERTVGNALKRLKEAGILNWLRRCVGKWIDGRFTLEQETNAYAVLPDTQWHGYTPPPECPPPAPGTWGDHPPLPSALAQAADAQRLRRGGEGRSDRGTVIRILESDPDRSEEAALARMLARLGHSVCAANPE